MSRIAAGLVESPGDLERHNLEIWLSGLVGFTPIASLEPGRPSDFAGIVRSVRVDPRDRSVEAVIDDGTGCITARWIDRPSFSELHIAPGLGCLVSDIPLPTESGRLLVIDPAYQVVSGAGVPPVHP